MGSGPRPLHGSTGSPTRLYCHPYLAGEHQLWHLPPRGIDAGGGGNSMAKKRADACQPEAGDAPSPNPETREQGWALSPREMNPLPGAGHGCPPTGRVAQVLGTSGVTGNQFEPSRSSRTYLSSLCFPSFPPQPLPSSAPNLCLPSLILFLLPCSTPSLSAWPGKAFWGSGEDLGQNSLPALHPRCRCHRAQTGNSGEDGPLDLSRPAPRQLQQGPQIPGTVGAGGGLPWPC